MRLPAFHYRSTYWSVGGLLLAIGLAASPLEIGLLKLLEAAEPPVVVGNEELTSLTLQLGDADFSVRQAAQAKLLAAGSPALAALETDLK